MDAGVRTWRAAALAGVLAFAMAGCASSGGNRAAGSSEEPIVHWGLDGDGEPTVGDVALTFSGGFDLTDDAVAFDGATGFASTSAGGPVVTTRASRSAHG